MKLIAVGDNVTDCYVDDNVYYPGGNAVNVVVNSKRDGAEKASYIGIFGNDENAKWIQECLVKEEIDMSRSRKVCTTKSSFKKWRSCICCRKKR
jgi:fructoselysine 6-kinase